MKSLLIIFTLFTTFALQPVLAEESADSPAPASPPAESADTGKGDEKAEKKPDEKKPAAGEAEPECD